MLTTIMVLAAAAGAESSGGLPQLNPDDFAPQLIWLAITFASLYFIMSRVALPRVGEVIEERRDRIQRDLDTAERLRDETDTALADYERALAEARSNAGAIAAKTRDDLTAETNQERDKAEAEIAAQMAKAEARIAATKTKALESVDEIARDTVGAIVSQLIGIDVSAQEKAAAVGNKA